MPTRPSKPDNDSLHGLPITITTDKNSSPSRLSSELEALHARFQDKSLTVEGLKRALKDRGTAVLLVQLVLPFCFVAIPSLSTPFGIAISLIRACPLIGREPETPSLLYLSAKGLTLWRD